MAALPGTGRFHPLDQFLEHDLLRGMGETLPGEPGPVCPGPVLTGGHCGVAAADQLAHSLVIGIGPHTPCSSPARNSDASIVAYRRSVLMCAPGLVGISEGATTRHG